MSQKGGAAISCGMQDREVIPKADALIVIDVQRAFVDGDEAVPDHLRLLDAIGVLLDCARKAGAPVLFLQNDGLPGSVDEPHTRGWELYFVPRPGEHVVRKKKDDGFDGTTLETIFRALHVRTLGFSGLLSEMCLAATARTAMQRGYRVILPHDAHATYDVPAGPGGSAPVPADMAARAAEWSLGDEIVILPAARDLNFTVRRDRTPA